MNSTEKGDLLEVAIEQIFQEMLRTGEFWGRPEYCSIHRRKGYYSKDRGGDIIFDVSIEFKYPGAGNFSTLTLIECKNYKHAVPVDDVEEFFAKAEQVAAANSKLVLASSAAFQKSAISYARSKGIGLIRYLGPSNFKWVLHRSPSAASMPQQPIEDELLEGLVQPDYKSSQFDFCMLTPKGLTGSFWEFFEGIYMELPHEAKTFKKFRNPKGKPRRLVPFLTLAEIERKCEIVLNDISYLHGEVSLEKICALEAQRCDLQVSRNCDPVEMGSGPEILGQISFGPSRIRTFRASHVVFGRERFTLAHELAHHFLCHGRFMSTEFIDAGDISSGKENGKLTADVARLEMQANLFAACLLMPKMNFESDFIQLIRWLGLHNRGRGLLYLDNQPCNHESFQRVTSALMENYGVSREAAAIRLQALGLLCDDRDSY